MSSKLDGRPIKQEETQNKIQCPMNMKETNPKWSLKNYGMIFMCCVGKQQHFIHILAWVGRNISANYIIVRVWQSKQSTSWVVFRELMGVQ